MSSDQSLTEEPLAKKKKTEDEVKAFKDQGKGKKSKKEGEEKKESSSAPKKVFNPLAEQRRKEKEQDATPAREGPKVKKADCRADGDLKAINKSSIQQGNKSEVRRYNYWSLIYINLNVFSGLQEAVHIT